MTVTDGRPTEGRTAAGMYYRQYGHGRRHTILLVHGWCCDHTFMTPIAEHFAGRHTRVIAVDMRGHGRSPAGDRGFTVEEFAADLVALVVELDLRGVVLIGHSMGGVWALAAAVEAPDRIATLVLLDSAVAVPPGTAASVAELAESLRGPDGRQVQESVIRSYFIAESEPRLVERVLDRMLRTAPEVVVGAVDGLASFVEAGADEALRRWGRRLLYVGGPAPFADYDRLRELVPGVVTGQTVGSGHFVQLEVPEQVNLMIDRYRWLLDR